VQIQLALVLAAAPPTAWENIKSVPKDTWINLVICVVAVVVIVRLWKAMKQLNDFLPYIAATLASLLILFYWVYERKEPRFLTPVVEKLVHFLPTRTKQGELIDQHRKGRDR
jgi:flagellar biosynthesis protein FliQ